MHWDRMFEDLEGQLASEWEAERAALDAESERLRISRLELRSRLRSLCGSTVVLELPGRRSLRGRLAELGADWVLFEAEGEHGPSAVPLTAVRGIGTDHGALLGSLRADDTASGVRERMTLGFVLRDLARRRVAVRIEDEDGAVRHGTIDRAGADHLDLAEHEPGTARRASEVRGFRIVPFPAIVRVRFEAT